MTIARRSHGGKRGLPRTPLRLRHPCSPRPPSCPSLAPATLLNPSRPSGGSGTSQPAQSAALSKTEDNSLSTPLPPARTSPVAKTPREHGSRDGDGTRTPGLRGSAVPLGSAECAVCVPSGSTEWHDISWQLRICRLPRHSVASSARCACHSMALSGTSVRQRSSGAIGEGAAPDGSTAAKGTWPTRARQRWRAAHGEAATLAHRGPRGAWYDGRQQPRDDGELSSGGSGSHYV